MNPLRLGLWQCHSVQLDTEVNLIRLDTMAARAKLAGVELLVCPELFLTGYNISACDIAKLAEPHDGPAAVSVQLIAEKHGVAIAYGYPERENHVRASADDVERVMHSIHAGEMDELFAGYGPAAEPPSKMYKDVKPFSHDEWKKRHGVERIFNSMQFVTPTGETHHYRKTHLFGANERAAFSPGTEASRPWVFKGWRLGALICYDVEFPETVRQLAREAVDLIIVPTANSRNYDFISISMVPTRAYENGLYIAYVNYSGAENGLQYGGLSCLATPDGRFNLRVAHTEELLVVDLSPEHLNHARERHTHLQDRRPELYRS